MPDNPTPRDDDQDDSPDEDVESLVQPLHAQPSEDDREVEETPPPAPFDEDREVVGLGDED